MPVKRQDFRRVGGGADSPARPYLKVRYINPHTEDNTLAWALIDTGADDCVLPASFAEILGHDLEAGERTMIAGVHGEDVAYRHTTIIKIPGDLPEDTFSTEETLISFVDNLPQPLLGVRSFLSHFKLTVNFPNMYFSLEKVERENPDDYQNPWPTP
jgi:predicted aspartyl protease